MNYYAADSFAGSGAIVGSAPPFKDAAVGNWALTTSGSGTGGDAGIWTRSAGGAVYTDDLTFSGFSAGTYLRALGTVAVGSGLCNFEVSGKGAFQWTIIFDAGAYTYTLSVEEDGTISGAIDAPSGFAFLSGSVSPLDETTTTVFRFEFSPTVSRAYVNGTLINTVTAGPTGDITRTSVYHGFSGTSPAGNTAIDGTSGFAGVLINYVNFQLNSTSGPLGAPGGPSLAITLPKLTMSGGEYGHGEAALSFFPLYVIGALPPAPPTFWTGYVGAREVP